MKTAKDMMHEAIIVDPEMPVIALAKRLVGQKIDGACVVKDQELLGVVTSMDLVFQEKNPHVPPFLSIMDSLIPLEPPSRMKKELEKIAGVWVKDIMTANPVTVSAETPLSELATLMVEKHITVLPVVEGKTLLGIITKTDVIRAAFHLEDAQ